MQDKIFDEKGQVSKSGGVVIHEINSIPHILLVYRGNHKDWNFPKGHTEKGESLLQAAQREIRQETGINTELIKELPSNEYVNTKNNEKTSCAMFLFKPSSFHVQTESSEDKAGWIPLAEVEQTLTHQNSKDYFRQIEPFLSV